MREWSERQSKRVTRRDLMAAAGAVAGAAMACAARSAAALPLVEVVERTLAPVRIAIPDLVATGGDHDKVALETVRETARAMTALLIADLRSVPALTVLDPAAYPDQAVDPNALPGFAQWRTMGVAALVTGRIRHEPDGRLRAEFRLWDVAAGQQLSGQQYFAPPEGWRAIAHAFAGTVCERITGEHRDFD
jgi:TolB protein